MFLFSLISCNNTELNFNSSKSQLLEKSSTIEKIKSITLFNQASFDKPIFKIDLTWLEGGVNAIDSANVLIVTEKSDSLHYAFKFKYPDLSHPYMLSSDFYDKSFSSQGGSQANFLTEYLDSNKYMITIPKYEENYEKRLFDGLQNLSFRIDDQNHLTTSYFSMGDCTSDIKDFDCENRYSEEKA